MKTKYKTKTYSKLVDSCDVAISGRAFNCKSDSELHLSIVKSQFDGVREDDNIETAHVFRFYINGVEELDAVMEILAQVKKDFKK
jgi:hypothetical protein